MSAPKEEARATEELPGREGRHHGKVVHGEDGSDADAIALDKPFTRLRACLCLRGIELYRLADGSYLATKWGWSKALPDLRAVETFARMVGA